MHLNIVEKPEKEKSKLSKEEWRKYTLTVWDDIVDIRSKGHPATFPEEIPRRLIKMFTFFGETVLDPFAGTGTTTHVARELGRNSIAVEVYPKYIKLIQDELNQRTLSEDQTTHETYERDARDLSFIAPNSIDLIVTSPPYWNSVRYGDRKDDLANIDDYEAFVAEVTKVFSECNRVLKKDRRMCVITANVHKKTEHGLERLPLASDFIMACRKIGFSLASEVIWSKLRSGSQWGVSGGLRPIFGSYPYPPNFLFMNVHEYILIFRKI